VPEADTIEWDDAAFDAAVERAAEGAIDARGVRLSSEQVTRLLDEVPRDPERPDRPLLRRASFRGTTFSGDADFRGATFSGDADFSGTTFSGDAGFHMATFSGEADFSGTTFSGDAGFHLATFSGDADFSRATFGGVVILFRTTFSDDANFHETTFSGGVRFLGTTFDGYADFYGATFSAEATFLGATFQEVRNFGPVLASRALALDGVVFAQSVRIVVSARRLSLARAVFRGGADVFVRWAEVSLEDADFAEPSLLAELPSTPVRRREQAFLGRDEPVADGWVCRLDAPPVRFAPRVVSARRAKLARLTVSGADLRACRFAGAHGLDGLRLERARFAQTPAGWQLRWRRPRWTRRQTIAEEHHWRARHGHGRGWYEGEVRASDWLGQASEPPESEQIAGIYRALRKGREDNKDEPGAADFYYGEMEMRRQPTGSPGARDDEVDVRPVSWTERWVLWLYWLVSGYGLRASRALIALAVTIALAAVLLDLFGFEPERGPDNGTLLFSIESSISLLRAPEAKLTAGGEVIQIALRLAGPLFFGLALLSLRGRVKR
jgi:uncharacterized protein YjbI with pentapeptide repeats